MPKMTYNDWLAAKEILSSMGASKTALYMSELPVNEAHVSAAQAELFESSPYFSIRLHYSATENTALYNKLRELERFGAIEILASEPLLQYRLTEDSQKCINIKPLLNPLALLEHLLEEWLDLRPEAQIDAIPPFPVEFQQLLDYANLETLPRLKKLDILLGIFIQTPLLSSWLSKAIAAQQPQEQTRMRPRSNAFNLKSLERPAFLQSNLVIPQPRKPNMLAPEIMAYHPDNIFAAQTPHLLPFLTTERDSLVELAMQIERARTPGPEKQNAKRFNTAIDTPPTPKETIYEPTTQKDLVETLEQILNGTIKAPIIFSDYGMARQERISAAESVRYLRTTQHLKVKKDNNGNTISVHCSEKPDPELLAGWMKYGVKSLDRVHRHIQKIKKKNTP